MLTHTNVKCVRTVIFFVEFSCASNNRGKFVFSIPDNEFFSFISKLFINIQLIFILFSNMSRTFAAIKVAVTANGNQLKTFAKNTEEDDEDVDVSSTMPKTETPSKTTSSTWDGSNKAHGAEGVVISHSKRKHDDDGTILINTLVIARKAGYKCHLLYFQFIHPDNDSKRRQTFDQIEH